MSTILCEVGVTCLAGPWLEQPCGCRRYVGDMLAWIHQAVASEHELLTSLMTSDNAPVDPSTSGSNIISTPELLDKVTLY